MPEDKNTKDKSKIIFLIAQILFIISPEYSLLFGSSKIFLILIKIKIGDDVCYVGSHAEMFE